MYSSVHVIDYYLFSELHPINDTVISEYVGIQFNLTANIVFVVSGIHYAVGKRRMKSMATPPLHDLML